ncbi:hypothetical protein B0F90DRAFT_1820375 [Multifurca ochricompacta]|uniref:N-acetyltransferase domain-containing protein n=1 Tax=Multifurca ochricompacta TaxID=376703 RepID=A0AAD4QL27_9AGAM|nr:hypothetical protein B0F90DRAFT_1820375 [Multifurca ochricompacta]
MSQIYVRKLEHPTPVQLDLVVNILIRAYAGDIAEQVFTGGDPALADLVWRSMIKAGVHSGVLYVASTEPESINAIGLWFPPGQLLYATPDQLALGFSDLLARLSPEHLNWFLNDFSAKTRELKARIFGPTLERDTWYANCIATDPSCQSRGLASAIINHVIAEAAETKSVVALGTQTEKNATFYRNRGFVEHGRLDADTPWGCFTGNIFIHQSNVQPDASRNL